MLWEWAKFTVPAAGARITAYRRLNRAISTPASATSAAVSAPSSAAREMTLSR